MAAPWWERAEDHIAEAYEDGRMSSADYNDEMRELGAQIREDGIE